MLQNFGLIGVNVLYCLNNVYKSFKCPFCLDKLTLLYLADFVIHVN